MANLAEAEVARRDIKDDWFRKDGVAGVGVGPLDPLDPTKGSAVVVFVDKGRRAELANQLPSYIDTHLLGRPIRVPVCIIEEGPFVANGVVELEIAGGDPEYARTLRPAKTGYSAGMAGGGTGTISMCIYLQGAAPQRKYFLSNAHVLSTNVRTSQPIILQAGSADPGATSFGTLADVCPLVAPPGMNRMDAAIAVPNNPDDILDLWDNRTMEVGQAPTSGSWEKCGRTTGRKFGNALYQHQNVHVDYKGWAGLSIIDFTDMLIISSPAQVSLPGDSGSMWVVNSDRVFAFAVNFAGSNNGKYSIAFPWSRVYEFWPPAQ